MMNEPVEEKLHGVVEVTAHSAHRLVTSTEAHTLKLCSLFRSSASQEMKIKTE